MGGCTKVTCAGFGFADAFCSTSRGRRLLRDLSNSTGGGSGCGGHGCGGHGCSSHSCGGGHGDSGGHSDPGKSGDDSSITSIISGCSSSDGNKKPRKGWDKPKTIREIFDRIFGLSPTGEQAAWYVSVTPEFFSYDEFRPDAEAVKALARKTN